MSKQEVTFAVGGTVQAKQGTYIKRPADDELFQACRAGEYAHVLACRQIGKSSLMVETASRLSREGVKTVIIDLNAIGKNVTVEEWYSTLIDILGYSLSLKSDEIQKWWAARPGLSNPARFIQFFRDVALPQVSAPIVIFIDEIDVILDLSLSFTDDFLAAIRTMYNERAQDANYNRVTFVLLGVASPDELIQENTRTAFNIGRAITLGDFTKEQCAPFRGEIEKRFARRDGKYFDQIYDWTSGHPFLTQKLCKAALESSCTDDSNLIEHLVKEIFLAPEAYPDDNIQYVQSRVKRDIYVQPMLTIYKQIIDKVSVADDEKSPAINHLKLYGLVINQSGQLRVRNKIYTNALDATWADEMLKTTGLRLPGKYTILKQIGQLEFITVYLAQDETDASRQSIAIKYIKIPHEAKPEWMSDWLLRLKHNADIIKDRPHPHIVKFLETTEKINDRILHITMDFIPGGSLRAWLQKNGRWTRQEAMELVRQIGQALQHSHEQGIYHLTVNPNDILLDTRHEPRQLVLTDFGLCKYLLDEPQVQRLHRDYINLRSQYVAPEYQVGKSASSTYSADIYGLAVTFFEVLTGHLPPNRQHGQPLPPLSESMPEIGSYFDDILTRATEIEPSARFAKVTEFMEAIEEVNARAEQDELSERQKRAAGVLEGVQVYIEKGLYDPERALTMIEAVFEIYPDFLDALLLRGRIRFRRGEFEKALTDYTQAYTQEQKPTSPVGLEYLDRLNQVADMYWRQGAFSEAAKHYETIQKILIDQNYDNDILREIRQTARSRTDELLRKKYQQIINDAQSVIGRISTQDTRFSDENIFQHYLALDEAYQSLLQLEPDNQQLLDGRRESLKERAETRAKFAAYALEKTEPDYQAALRHYTAIRDIESLDSSIVQELNLDLSQQIQNLQTTLGHYDKYQAVERLIEDREYDKALGQLDRDFIKTGNYEYQEVAKRLWQLVQAKRNNGNFPPEWLSTEAASSLLECLTGMEQERLPQLEADLRPWSRAKVMETIGNKNKTLGEYEERINTIEAMLADAVAQGVAQRSEQEKIHQELSAIKDRIQVQRDAYLQIVQETDQKVEAWLNQMNEIKKELNKPDQPPKDMLVLFNQFKEEQQAITQDQTLERLHKLAADDVNIRQTLNQTELQMQRTLIKALFERIHQKDEALVKAHQEETRARAELAQAQTATEMARSELVEAQKRESWIKQRAAESERLYKIFSISLIPGLIMGGVIGIFIAMIAPEIKSQPVPVVVVAGAAFVFWVASWIYVRSRR